MGAILVAEPLSLGGTPSRSNQLERRSSFLTAGMQRIASGVS